MIYLLDLDDDTLLAVMQALPCRLVRGPLLVCHRLLERQLNSGAFGRGHPGAATSPRDQCTAPATCNRTMRQLHTPSATLGDGQERA